MNRFTHAGVAREDNIMSETMKLSAAAKSLIGRVALERGRPTLWAESSKLRGQANDMLATGQSDGAVTAWLQALLGDALQAQAKGKY